MRNIYIAGKNDIACKALEYVVREMDYPLSHVRVVPNPDDTGVHTWQRSLTFTARQLGVAVIDVEDMYADATALFISLEYGKIVKPELFATQSLYNIHFSKLPAYRGVGMAVWPIVNGETESGVTLHRIDSGIDSGEIIAQRVFPLPLEWTSRDLYQAFLDHGFKLFRENIAALVADSVCSHPQSSIGASYFRRGLLDYAHLQVDFRRTAYEVHNQLRAYSFWEYQLPLVEGRKVLRSAITEARSVFKPGMVRMDGPYHGFVSTIDHDVELFFSPYDDLWRWAEGVSDGDVPLTEIADIDRQNRHGWSAAMIAAYHGRSDRLQKLLEAGAAVSQCNLRGTTLLMYAKENAVRTSDRSCLKLLLSVGADPATKDVRGKSVLDYLADSGESDLFNFVSNIGRDAGMAKGRLSHLPGER